MKYCVLILFLFLPVYSCIKENDVPNKFRDPLLITIAELQDRRSGDSLSHYLNNSDPSYQQPAALAYASLQDSNYVELLQNLLLSDADTIARKAAAYALGQTPSAGSEAALFEAASKESTNGVLREIIQAYGKVSKLWRLKITTEDPAMSEALGWAYYRMAVRGNADDSLNSKAAQFLLAREINTRLAAAHYFARGAKDFQRFESVLMKTALNDESDEVRMAAALALGKIKSDSSLHASESVIKNDSDCRVRINAVRAVQNFPLDRTKQILIGALNDTNVNVGITASETLKSVMTKEHWKAFHSIARATANWRIQANLYEAALSVSDHKELVEEIRSVYNKSTNSYQKAGLLGALKHSVMSYEFLREQLVGRNEPVVKSAAASALVEMNYHKNFNSLLSDEFAKIYEQAVNDGDAAVIGIVSSALADSTLNYKAVINDINFLKVARSKLSLPKDYESIIPLEAAIAHFEGTKSSTSLSNDFNHPINWSIVKKIPSDQKAVIKTSKGDITIRLLVEEAPGSVANFVSLASNGYYDNKHIHRVVPNFVVQDGCPRGDGWGSEAYSIRSEFSPRPYRTGSVGMASAGKDTEGTQWFITHSPTPHLEGRYTLFAEVISGMEVVHTLEVGDSVISVEIINFKLL